MTALALLLLAGGDYSDPDLTAADRRHWSFVAPVAVPPPAVRDGSRVRTAVDCFILSKLEAAGRTLAPEADRRTLLRRLFFDLTGLPPTPEEAAAYLNDPAPDAYERLVERLLASPHYGERWAQHWLDVVRFGESNGYELDADRPHAWRYRDYVVEALNRDVPYDRFLTEQVAGDLLPDRPLAATGLHRCGPVHLVAGNVDPAENRNEVLTEMVNGLGSAVLGLTVGCARCHDHKFDPISLGDYYRLQAFFAGTRYKDYELATADEKATHAAAKRAVEAKLAPLTKRIGELEGPTRRRLTADKTAGLPVWVRLAFDTPAGRRTAGQKKLVADHKAAVTPLWEEVIEALPPADRAERAALRAEQVRLEEELPPPLPRAWAVADDPTPPPHHVLKRGSVRAKAAVATPAVPRVADLGGPAATRLDLAKWLTDRRNPLTARVLVNRVWRHHFGRGLVATPNDFGTRGDRPTHPDLLDFLAVRFMDAGWSLKAVHREVVRSAAYRQRSGPTFDPLLGRQLRKRRDAESLRDAILTSAGTLNRQVGGPSVRVPLEPEVYDLIFTESEPVGLWPVTKDVRQHDRRGLYLFAKRNVRQPLLEAFDQPDALGSCAVRGTSTFAPQALVLMNGPFARDHAGRLADRLTAAPDPVADLWQRAFSRPPTRAERAAAADFLTAQPLADLCLAAFNLNEFLYVD
jgi:hypothetical protein